MAMESEALCDRAADATRKSKAFVRRAEPRGLDGLPIQDDRAVQLIGGKEGVHLQQVMQIVGQKFSANFGVGYEEVSEQVDRHLGTGIHMDNVANFIPGGLVGIECHAEPERSSPGASCGGELGAQLDIGLVVGARGVQLRSIELHFEADVQTFASNMAVEVEVAKKVALSKPVVVVEVVKRGVEFMVECGAVFAVAFQLEGNSRLPPTKGSRISRHAVNEDTVEAKHPCLVLSNLGTE